MRILVKLRSIGEFEYDLEYYSKIQAFIYKLIKGSAFDYIHSKVGYKFFCFSNIFPLGNIHAGELKKLLISSPSSHFIKYLYNRLRQFSKNEYVRIGDMYFYVDSIRVFKVRIPSSDFMILTSTPVIIRIPRKYFELYGIKVDKPWVYWRMEYGLKSFMNMTRLNLFKKYSEFYGEAPPTTDIYQQIKYVKSVAVYTNIDGTKVQFIGSLWRFRYTYIDNEVRRILEFILDTGLGERNSLGFGFLNIIKLK